MPKRHMRKPSLDAASAVFAVSVFAVACIVGAYLLIELAIKAVD